MRCVLLSSCLSWYLVLVEDLCLTLMVSLWSQLPALDCQCLCAPTPSAPSCQFRNHSDTRREILY
ncbi:hypothetical protein BV22DRAFT_1039269 [Leucogyrophana mollusca]|uniref:Uncharacterized protein n=1 Tax=Leucogyrophana mollusca TaxID=85980 RepID=A0ACB8B685_9AGAM|nr:hypothetical protein BV22DRAFT_1039269 [Leucogyrophana mollusca]